MTRPFRFSRAASAQVALVVLAAAAAVAQLPPTEALDPLQERARALAAQPDLTAHARGALSQADRALSRSRRAQAGNDAAAAVRASRIASAALTLAERRLAQARAQGELAFRARRAEELGDELRIAEQALGVERARLLELRQAFAESKEESDAVGP